MSCGKQDDGKGTHGDSLRDQAEAQADEHQAATADQGREIYDYE